MRQNISLFSFLTLHSTTRYVALLCVIHFKLYSGVANSVGPQALPPGTVGLRKIWEKMHSVSYIQKYCSTYYGTSGFFACYIWSHCCSSWRQQLVRHPANDGSCTREQVIHSRQRCIGTTPDCHDMLARLELIRSSSVVSSLHSTGWSCMLKYWSFKRKCSGGQARQTGDSIPGLLFTCLFVVLLTLRANEYPLQI